MSETNRTESRNIAFRDDLRGRTPLLWVNVTRDIAQYGSVVESDLVWEVFDLVVLTDVVAEQLTNDSSGSTFAWSWG